MMIDGQLYPLHCAISSHWKIHYFTAEMADKPAHRAVLARFPVGPARIEIRHNDRFLARKLRQGFRQGFEAFYS
jgi:hypothetical protein